MAKGHTARLRYKYPLPIHPIDDLPDLIPQNPLSWAYWTYCYLTKVNYLKFRIPVEIIGQKYVHILVRNSYHMQYLWENGFFGTGQFSRSEPTWKNRTLERLNIGLTNTRINTLSNNTIPETLQLEEITKRRRMLRIEFKQQREKLEKQLLQLRKNNGSIEEEKELLEKEREMLRDFKAKQSLIDIEHSFNNNERLEDFELIDTNGNIIELEALELLPVEAIFLTFSLPVLNISVQELCSRLVPKPVQNIKYDDIQLLIRKYIVYHHYRSRGWCVRSGIKFGCEYLLYKRGPPFQHAEFCVLVLDAEESQDYTWYSSIARVIGGARKSLVLCYVHNELPEKNILQLWKSGNFTELFSKFNVGEIVYKRWVPGKNRD
ncbi:hypothetical protein TBLA_0D03980 [Henningerozyma blattae CBS 6284]|uniref:tRNA-splicing endonuclease subunit Sen2 n=1 Tax=Henningerozyma blattae (strain ATCC 34711 / CBS 6284 / DSM 70876 / NBRC 10599 / NRRL Y-10934 / UCD 77-7) TaxID=1071380 RepID=I2H3E3_HENB6|nr:hypothetical protein TBLA_0D03980 [Tetrapisispora blattae CBS 6284]CCH60895.1 hypothetical protein TBLA_0D03980 [Tetrapisispora blattae CBS 6284]